MEEELREEVKDGVDEEAVDEEEEVEEAETLAYSFERSLSAYC